MFHDVWVYSANLQSNQHVITEFFYESAGFACHRMRTRSFGKAPWVMSYFNRAKKSPAIHHGASKYFQEWLIIILNSALYQL